MRRRSSFLKYDEEIELGNRGLTVWAYGKDGQFVCRVEINAAGLALFSGTKGRKRIIDIGWEGLVQRLGTKSDARKLISRRRAS